MNVVGDCACVYRMDIDWGLGDLPLDLELVSPIDVDMDCDNLFSGLTGMETGVHPSHPCS